MSLDGLRVNHAGLDTAAEDLGRTVKQIDDRLNRLESELAPLRSDWTGSAQQAYQTAKAKVGCGDAGDEGPARRDGDDRVPVQPELHGRRPARRRVVRHLTHDRTGGRRGAPAPIADPGEGR